MSGVELIGTAGILAETSAVTVTLADAIAVAGAVAGAAGAVSSGQAAQRQASFEAQQLQIQAERDREIARQQAQDFERDEDRRRAALRARVAGSGVTLEGSPLAVLGDLAAEAEFQRRRILAGGETASTRARSQADIRRFEGRSSRSAGATRAGASLLTGAARVFE